MKLSALAVCSVVLASGCGSRLAIDGGDGGDGGDGSGGSGGHAGGQGGEAGSGGGAGTGGGGGTAGLGGGGGTAGLGGSGGTAGLGGGGGTAGLGGGGGTAGLGGSGGTAGLGGGCGLGGVSGGGGLGGGGAGGLGGIGGAGGAGGVTPSCGNGAVEAGEACDDGNGSVTDACPDGPQGTCQNAFCGDGFTDYVGGTEACDDSNGVPTDGCDNCAIPAACGNAAPDAGEACDLGTAANTLDSGDCPTTCRPDCTCPRCGDSVRDFARGEECDDGNTANGDGCDSGCAVESLPTCGDGVTDPASGENCDDGGQCTCIGGACVQDSQCGAYACTPRNGDGCSATCQFDVLGGTCGDNTVDPLEKCDDGNTTPGDTCNPTCNLFNEVTTLLGYPEVADAEVTTDDTYLYFADRCAISRVVLQDCIDEAKTGLPVGGCTPVVLAGQLGWPPCGTPTDDAVGTLAILRPANITTDGRTLWFAERGTIRAIDLGDPNFAVSTLVGDPTKCAAVDADHPLNYFGEPFFYDIQGLTYDSGFLYLVDACENVVRQIDTITLMVRTIAGSRAPNTGSVQQPSGGAPNSQDWVCGSLSPNFTCDYSTPSSDGFGLNAVFTRPMYIDTDGNGTLFINDTRGFRLRTYDISTAWVGTIAGNGTSAYADGIGAAIRLRSTRGIASDGTSLYWGETDGGEADSGTIRQMVIATRHATTLAGVRGCQATRDGQGGDGTVSHNYFCGEADPSWALFASTNHVHYHYNTRSLLVVDAGGIRIIE